MVMSNILIGMGILSGVFTPYVESMPKISTTHVESDQQASIVVTNPIPRIPDRATIPIRSAENTPPRITARSAIVVDADSGAVLYEKNADEVLPIASLTKVLTWLVFYDHRPKDWNTPVALSEYNNRLSGAKLQEFAGEHMTLSDLVKTALVGSANNATEAMAESTGLPLAEFTTAMNTKARALGASTFHVEETTGLSEFNVASARDYAAVLRHARHFPDITAPLRQNVHEFVTLDALRYHRIKGSNRFAERDDIPLVMAKTGYTEEAGWCVATVLSNQGNQVIVVVLGSESTTSRFAEAEELFTYVTSQFSWDSR